MCECYENVKELLGRREFFGLSEVKKNYISSRASKKEKSINRKRSARCTVKRKFVGIVGAKE